MCFQWAFGWIQVKYARKTIRHVCYSPALKRGGGGSTEFVLSIHPSQYLENKLIEFHQVLYMH